MQPRDASCLFEGRYVEWVRSRGRSPLAQATPPGDVASLVAWYDGTPGAFWLGSLPLLHDDVAGFLSGADLDFGDVARSDPGRARLARFLLRHLPGELLELFRSALRREVRSGYLELRERHVVPLYETELPRMATELRSLAACVRGLAGARLAASHPLRRYGRVLWPGPEEPLVVVGVPCEELGVSARAPLVQAVHEHVVAEVSRRVGTAAELETRSGATGFEHHFGLEVAALSIEAQLLGEGRHRTWFCRWLAQWVPDSCAALARKAPWPVVGVPAGRGIEEVAGWLASGEVVPGALREAYVSARAWFLETASGSAA